MDCSEALPRCGAEGDAEQLQPKCNVEVLLNQPGEFMSCLHRASLLVLALLLLGGCATRPINPPITQADPSTGYRFETRQAHARDKDNLVVLAFSGGGTRAAAFSYG